MLKDMVKLTVPLILLLIIIEVYFPTYFEFAGSLINMLIGVLLVYAATKVQIDEMKDSTEREIRAINEINQKIEETMNKMVAELAISSTRLAEIATSLHHLEKSMSKTKKEYEEKVKEFHKIKEEIKKEEQIIRKLLVKANIYVYFDVQKSLLSKKYYLVIKNEGADAKDVELNVVFNGKNIVDFKKKIPSLPKNGTKRFLLPYDLTKYDEVAININYVDQEGNADEILYEDKLRLLWLYGKNYYIRRKKATIWDYLIILAGVGIVVVLYIFFVSKNIGV